MSVQLAQGVLKGREDVSSPWSNIMVEVSPDTDVSSLASNFAEGYNNSHTYNTGDLCTYEEMFYKCKTNGVTGTWDSTKWDRVTVDDIAAALQTLISNLNAVVVKDHICVQVNATANGTGTASISGMTADHVLDSIQFYSDNALTTPIGSAPADISWSTSAGSVSITVANKGSSSFYMLLSFAYKPIQETITIS